MIERTDDPVRDSLDARAERADAADDEVHVHAALAARYRAWMQSGSTIALSLKTIRAGRPAWRMPDLPVDELEEPGTQRLRRHEQPRKERWRDRPVRTLNRSVTSAPSSGRHDRSPRST